MESAGTASESWPRSAPHPAHKPRARSVGGREGARTVGWRSPAPPPKTALAEGKFEVSQPHSPSVSGSSSGSGPQERAPRPPQQRCPVTRSELLCATTTRRVTAPADHPPRGRREEVNDSLKLRTYNIVFFVVGRNGPFVYPSFLPGHTTQAHHQLRSKFAPQLRLVEDIYMVWTAKMHNNLRGWAFGVRGAQEERPGEMPDLHRLPVSQETALLLQWQGGSPVHVHARSRTRSRERVVCMCADRQYDPHTFCLWGSASPKPLRLLMIAAKCPMITDITNRIHVAFFLLLAEMHVSVHTLVQSSGQAA